MPSKPMLNDILVHNTLIDIAFTSNGYNVAVWLIVFHLTKENDLKLVKLLMKPIISEGSVVDLKLVFIN
jgi:hypothetical protein